MRRKLLPFYDERKCKIDMIVLHCVAYEPKDAVAVFREHKVSTHYVIGTDGEIWQLVGENHRAWHAGKSFWQGMTDINSHSIGIELVSLSLGQTAYNLNQKKSLVLLLRRLIKKYKILPQNIVGHSDIAPNRKADPGKDFFWEYLNTNGIGIVYDSKLKDKVQSDDERELLQIIGYDTADLPAAKMAFCRHFLPQSIEYEKNILAMEENMPKIIEKFVAPDNFMKVLQNVAQQYAKASKTPCKM